MTALHQAGRWKDVLPPAEELGAAWTPTNPDPGGMVSDAQAKLGEAELADRYAQGVNHIKQAHWQKAVAVFTYIEQEQPGYRDTPALLMRLSYGAIWPRGLIRQPPPQHARTGTLLSAHWRKFLRSIRATGTLVPDWSRHGQPSDSAHSSTK